MAIRFTDISSFSREAVDRTPKTFEARVGAQRLLVTRHIHHPGEWRCTWGSLEWAIKDCPAKEAQGKALDYLRGSLTETLKQLG